MSIDTSNQVSGSNFQILNPTSGQTSPETQDINRVYNGKGEQDTGSYENYTEYTVKSGDTLKQIAKNYGVELKALIKANNLENPDIIHPGDKINIPINKNEQESIDFLNNISRKYPEAKGKIITTAPTSGGDITVNIGGENVLVTSDSHVKKLTDWGKTIGFEIDGKEYMADNASEIEQQITENFGENFVNSSFWQKFC